MKKLLCLFLVFSVLGVSAQSVSKQVISPLGGSASSDTHQLSYTTGEVVVGAMTSEDGSIQLGNGYYPSMDLEALSLQTPNTNLVVKVFPNPVTEALYITHPTAVLFEVQLTDISGKLLFKTTHQKDQPLSMQGYAPGTYLIAVSTQKSNQINTYKIIKR